MRVRRIVSHRRGWWLVRWKAFAATTSPPAFVIPTRPLPEPDPSRAALPWHHAGSAKRLTEKFQK
jgi:hypothetical protein